MLPTNLDMKVLLSTKGRPGQVPALGLPGKQIVCGPRWLTVQAEGRILSIETPQTYDLAEVIERIPDDQKPDLVIVKTDAFWVNAPRNLAAVRCPKILLFGDTHHGDKPIRNLLRYLDDERFEAIVLLHDRHHAHWLAEGGHEKVHFLPALEIQRADLPFLEERQMQIVFVGQTGKLHLRRTNLLEELGKRGFPLRIQEAEPDEANRLYGSSLITFNCSLNGDLNMRVFETLQSGGFLLTDRLSPQSGLGDLFEDGKHLVCYDSPGELVEKAAHYLAHPNDAISIARAGYERCQELFDSGALVSDISALLPGLTGGSSRIGLEGELRVAFPVCERSALESRAAFYEFMQDIHRQREVVRVLCIGAVERVCDICDLPRLRTILLEEATTEADLVRIQSAGLAEQVWMITAQDAVPGAWDTVMISADQIEFWIEMVLSKLQFRRLVISEMSPDAAASIVTALSSRGFVPIDIQNLIFERQDPIGT